MDAVFTKATQNDFRKHNNYVRNQRKSNGHRYQQHELTGINKSFKKNLKDNLEKIKDPKNSIFPKEFEYNSDSHKMYVDKKSHHIVFYKVINPKKGKPYISIEKCIHSTELSKELDKKDIKPLNNADPELLLDYITVEKEDKVKDDSLTDEERDEYKKKEDELKERISNKKQGVEKEDEDENGNPRQYKTGPQGGKYYRVKIDGKWGDWHSLTNENLKNIKSYITESKMVSLLKYIKGLIGVK